MKLHTSVVALLVLAHFASAQTPPTPTAPAQSKPAEGAPAKAAPAQGEDSKAPATSSTFTAEQLEQIVAPIALHPDALLSQILMASTYPLEIVEAYRWVQKNPSLKGKELEEALKKQEWDPAVKSICGLPTVLKQMNDSLDWTQDLGDAFLGQKEELMKTVQKMRKKALEAGNLKSGEQQTVTQDGDIIIIESTKTEVVYVPTYYPTAVYGGWSYPYYYYPPMYPPYPTGGVMFGFAVGIAWAGCWGGCNWHGNNVYINHNTYNNFNRNTNINGGRDNLPNNGRGDWNHNPEHRKGANYKDSKTAQKYGAGAGSNRVTKDQARGYDRSSGRGGTSPAASNRPSAGTGATGGARPSAGGSTRPSSGASTRPSSGASSRPTPKTTPKTGGSGSALSGSRSPSLDRSASTRGAASRGGGGGRSGGGGRGGGGGRR